MGHLGAAQIIRRSVHASHFLRHEYQPTPPTYPAMVKLADCGPRALPSRDADQSLMVPRHTRQQGVESYITAYATGLHKYRTPHSMVKGGVKPRATNGSSVVASASRVASIVSWSPIAFRMPGHQLAVLNADISAIIAIHSSLEATLTTQAAHPFAPSPTTSFPYA